MGILNGQWAEGTDDRPVDRKYALNTSIAVTATQQTISTIKKRKTFIIINTSPNAADIISITLGNSPAVANYGIVLKQGGAYGETTDQVFDAWDGAINVVCATANGTISFMER